MKSVGRTQSNRMLSFAEIGHVSISISCLCCKTALGHGIQVGLAVYKFGLAVPIGVVGAMVLVGFV